MPSPTPRLLTLLSIMQTGGTWPGATLVERLSISHRTLRRDVDHLRQLGYCVNTVMGPDGGYRLDAGSELPPLLFDDEQIVALAAALQVGAGSASGLIDASARARATIRQVLPSRLRHRIDAATASAIPRSGDAPSPAVDPHVLAAVGSATHNTEVLRFDYSNTPDAPARRVEPHGIVTQAGRWYLVAWDLDRHAWRLFRIDRMRPRLATRLAFTPRAIPGGDAATFVGARLKGSERADVWPCIGTVELAVPARDIAPFLGDGTVEDLAAGRCRLTAGSWSWIALAASIGRFDADITSAQPPELAQAFATLADRFSRASHCA
ncbi:helix-turn-helix transcriptional regulator [Paramicrobacterium chengjingii]|uniref:helix-turn-helix transcriptional regulator n=1 Tax=Paramicrobacterium chengjingii TaxID=2769067 RepID=UPI0014228CAB|nr:WYL domain-containing protein [Microbacterium chengjingii]